MLTKKTKRRIIPDVGAFHIRVDRRRFFKSMAAASGGFTMTGYLAEALTLSPIVTQGPYYPLARTSRSTRTTTSFNSMIVSPAAAASSLTSAGAS